MAGRFPRLANAPPDSRSGGNAGHRASERGSTIRAPNTTLPAGTPAASDCHSMTWLGDFRDRVVVVTGASSGIGRATALAFAAAGARVAVVARRRELLDEVARAAAERGAGALVVPADVTRRGDVARCFRTVLERFGHVDVVVNNAGVLIPAPVATLRAADLQAMFDVNVFGALAVMQEGLGAMRGRGGGVIVNVASLAGRRGISPLGGYCASKFALVGLTEALRSEIHGEDVHVALVLPGVVETPMVVEQAPEFRDLWPSALDMPPVWVVWAIFAAVRFRLVEISVPPGAATLEELGALAPGVSDALLHWVQQASHWLGRTVAARR
jgi:NAD(P)-dependent dehydrogenase (short-subunit alcohol dehydrogenase family)